MTTTIFQNTRPNIQNFLDFNESTIFGPEDSERLVSTSHLGAIEEMLDASHLPETEDVEAWLTTNTEFWTIAAYKPDNVSAGDMEQWAEWHAEHMREAFGEDYGDEDGEDRLSDADAIELKRRTDELVKWYVSRAKVWRCEQVRTFTFDSADVLEMVREIRPEWLKKRSERNV
jgi:hypothetical protein